MKVSYFLTVGVFVGLAFLFSSCSNSVPSRLAYEPAFAPPASPESAGDLVTGGNRSGATTAPLKKARTGIATGWGRVVESKMSYRKFERSSAQPKAVSIIRYNDRSGAKAMGLNFQTGGDGMREMGNGLVEWGMSTGLTKLESYRWRGDRFVIGKEGREYQIQVKNLSEARLEVVLSVDGLDVMDGQAASTKKRGYLIEPGKKLTIRGFRTSEDKVATFKFSSVDGSYANLRHGKTRNVGIVGLALFTEKGREPGAENRLRGGARAFAVAPQVRGR